MSGSIYASHADMLKESIIRGAYMLLNLEVRSSRSKGFISKSFCALNASSYVFYHLFPISRYILGDIEIASKWTILIKEDFLGNKLLIS
jgi:hypothetical protein